MNDIFSFVPLPETAPTGNFDCGRNSGMLLFENFSPDGFETCCKKIADSGFSLFAENKVGSNIYRTYSGKITVHIYFCADENSMRIVADPYTDKFDTAPDLRRRTHQTTFWQFEVDHSLIDCGMCYVVRCCDGSFFVVDSAHPYSVNDDIRLPEFLTALNGGKKPTVAGWFFSHGHSDHIGKFMDILEYHRNELDIETVYYNFVPTDHRDSHCWDESEKQMIHRFESLMDKNPDIRKIRLHSGQKFFVRNLEFTVLCTHEDIHPNPLCDFNNSSIALMLSSQGSKVLLPGDCSAESDKVLVRRWGDLLKCDVVQMSHHGHSGTSPEFYRLANAECALFPITEIKFDEELPRQEANRTAIELCKEYHIASNGTVKIDLPYVFGKTEVLPDETFEDFDGIFNLWTYSYTDEYKKRLYDEFVARSKK